MIILLSSYCEMGNIKNKNKIGKVVSTQDIGSVVKYTNAPFFKKKDEEAIIFLEKHPVPIDFWKN
jgi:hypothetical protein